MWLLVHIVTTAYPKSKFFLSSPENQNSLLFMPRKLPFCQMTFVRNLPALNTEETRGHTMKCLSVWDVTVQLGRELTTSDSSFPSQCHIRWNAQSRYPPNSTITRQRNTVRRVLPTMVSSRGKHIVPIPVLMTTRSWTLPLCLLTSQADHYSWIRLYHGLHCSPLLFPWLSITHETKPKFCGLVFSALHNFMPTCFLLHSPPPNLRQKCVCTRIHTHRVSALVRSSPHYTIKEL